MSPLLRILLMSATVVLALGWSESTSAAPAPRLSPKPSPRLAPGKIVVLANNHYAYGRYETVVQLLRPIVEHGLLKRRADRLEGLRLYGICLYLTGRKSAAAQVFRSLIDQAPQTRLDPRIVQPEVVAAFERIRLPRLRRLQDQARRRRDLRKERARRKLARRWAILNMVPTAGQFQNGHWKKGLVVLSLELTMLGANLASYYALKSTSLRQPDGTFVQKDADGNVLHDRKTLAKVLMGINYASLGVLVGTLVYGAIDGFYFYFRRSRRLNRILERPAPPTVSVMPLVAPGGGGVSLTLTF